jgi:hypothetical protein
MGKWIDRTKTGLLLLLVGTILAAIPLIGIIGTILAAIGAIMVILGRRAFGDKHSKYVLFSVGVYIFGFIVLFFVALAFAFSVASAASSATSASALIPVLNSALNSFIIEAIIGGAISSFAYVLITYAVQNQTGRILLWAAYGISLAMEVVIFLIITPQISTALNASIATGTYDPTPIRALQAQISSLGILSLIPNAIYALAYYLVYSRVNKGEIPPRTTTQPPSPPTPPPTPRTM